MTLEELQAHLDAYDSQLMGFHVPRRDGTLWWRNLPFDNQIKTDQRTTVQWGLEFKLPKDTTSLAVVQAWRAAITKFVIDMHDTARATTDAYRTIEETETGFVVQYKALCRTKRGNHAQVNVVGD